MDARSRGRNHRFSRLVGIENARRVLEQPEVLRSARAHLDRFSKGDPGQADGYALWDRLLGQGPEAVAAALRDPSPWGDYARETAPSFGGLPAPVRASLIRQARADAGRQGGEAG